MDRNLTLLFIYLGCSTPYAYAYIIWFIESGAPVQWPMTMINVLSGLLAINLFSRFNSPYIIFR